MNRIRRMLLSSFSLSGKIINEDGSTTEIIKDDELIIEKTTKEEDGITYSQSLYIDDTGNIIGKDYETIEEDGNRLQQTISIDSNGNEIVTGYIIDTSDSSTGEKVFNNNEGINTEYYAFDMTHGFEMVLHFTIDFTNQPPGQSDNHHNIMAMKRQDTTPWYGFQIRQSSTNKYIQIGTQFETGSNTNVTITTTNDNKVNGSENIYEYNIKIVYDPTIASNQFVLDEFIGGYHQVNNGVFPDIEALKYIKVTIGCALDGNGNPYRFSNINVKNFYIEQLKLVKTPVISLNNNIITLSCETQGATIYYKLNHLGNYVAYTNPISIEEDTYIETYAELNNEKSNHAKRTCEYDNGIPSPVITCDGEFVSIACSIAEAPIYYRLNETGEYVEYTDSFEINANTIVEAYAELNSLRSHVSKESCSYNPIILEVPTIHCNGEQIILTCNTANAVINYRLNQEGSYSVYTTPITILEDTVIETYSTYKGRVSSVVTETCIYSDVHNYSLDYLTFQILENGVIPWKANTTVKTIEYSLNNGAWTSITSTAAGVMINVSQGDTIRFRGNNATYCNVNFVDDEDASYFSLYNCYIYGNIMSLIYSTDYASVTTMTSDNKYAFRLLFRNCDIYNHPTKELLLPATTLAEGCYYQMFWWCRQLTSIPELPATTLSKDCYAYMFYHCMGLTEVPELPATTLAPGAYSHMFTVCENITSAAELPATILYSHCYESMFEGCKKLITPPTLPATTLADYCYSNMFQDCRRLNYIKCMATNKQTNSTENWVNYIVSSGTFIKNENCDSNFWETGANGIPSGWTVQTATE